MESLPIDINYNKLLDWLINRRHCSQQWQPVATVIRQKIIHAVAQMEGKDFNVPLPDPTAMTYFDVKEILDDAKNTESGKKNFFGQYASQNMKEWAEIAKLYERDGIYLAETAQMITRDVNYEIPAVKKQIAKCQQLQKECERKETDFANGAADLRKKYEARCKEMGIEGKKIKTELAALVGDLPADLDRIAASAKELESAVKYYDNFVAFLLGREHKEESVPMLKFVMSRGNSRVYEWRTGSAPEVVEEQSIKIDLSDEMDAATESEDIDWGAGEDDNGIDFGDDIDLGITNITVESGGAEVIGDGDNGDWLQVKAERSPSLPEGVAVAVTGVARGEDALSLLDNTKTRNLFVDDLMELESFLSQRLADLGAEDSVSGGQLQGAGPEVQVDAEGIKVMLAAVQSLVSQLTSTRMQHLLLIGSSPRYVDRLCGSLRQTLQQADQCVMSGQAAASRSREASEEEAALWPTLTSLGQHARAMQRHMEADIATKYKDRKVNIVGEINTIG